MIGFSGTIFFLVLIVIIIFFIVRWLGGVADKQAQQMHTLITYELRNVFKIEPIFYDSDKAHYEADQILACLKTPFENVFDSRFQPKRWVVEGTDERRRTFIACTAEHPERQSGGTRRYTFFYALKNVKASSGEVYNINDQLTILKNELVSENKESSIMYVTCGEWLVGTKIKLMKGYQGVSTRYNELIARLDSVIDEKPSTDGDS